MIKFPKIEQFSSVVYRICDYAEKNNLEPLKVKYIGTPKIHGTNCSVSLDVFGGKYHMIPQSKNTELSIKNTNHGFYNFFMNNETQFKDIFLQVLENYSLPITIFGEWAGKGVWGGVAVSNEERFFTIFAIASGENENKTFLSFDELKNIQPHNNKRIFNIAQFGHYEVDVDFTKPEIARDKFVKYTEQVEKECPVGKYFGHSGVGEGVVWIPQHEYFINDSEMWFKVKGKKHSVTKTKTLAPVDLVKVASVNEFVEYACTENRMKQAIQEIFNTEDGIRFDIKKTGKYIQWLQDDIAKEELNALLKNNLTLNDVSVSIANVARNYLFKNYKD